MDCYFVSCVFSSVCIRPSWPTRSTHSTAALRQSASPLTKKLISATTSLSSGTNMSTRILEKCIAEHTPEYGPCKNSRPHNTFLHIAAVVKRGKVLATAQNRLGSRSRGSGYSSQTIHAERAVIKKIGDISKIRGATLCVWRISAINVLPSKPCRDCQVFLEKCMKEYGLQAVQYSDTILPL